MTLKDKGAKESLSISKKTAKKKNIEILKKDIQKLSYEETIHELENILLDVQNENISLDQIQINYVKGHLLLKHCQELLLLVEQEINEIDSEFLN
tara:strand:+ start:285 stop:569 length:285 start_codon:yes stop_codon:yes gene_type:complete